MSKTLKLFIRRFTDRSSGAKTDPLKLLPTQNLPLD